MPAFNLDDYAPVEERIALFYAAHPDGRIVTSIAKLDPPLVVFKALVYRTSEDDIERPWATGFAYEKEGEGHVNRTSYIENCETSAIGRALANAGYHGKREGAPRPSREEMQKVERMGGTPAPEPQGNSMGGDAFSLDTILSFGRHSGRSWRELVEEHPAYVSWAVGNLNKLDESAKRTLAEALGQRA